MYGNIDSYFPSSSGPEYWGDIEQQLGSDEYASWKKPEHTSTRFDLYRYWMEKGWELK